MHLNGDDVAALYVRHAPRALRIAYLLSGDHGAAEDLVHDSFVTLCSKRPRLRDPTRFDSYLRKMVLNNYLASRRKPRPVLDESRLDTPEQINHSVEDHDQLERILRSLPPRQRMAVVLRHYVQLTEAEAAEEMRCSIGTVKSLTSRGLTALRQTWVEDANER